MDLRAAVERASQHIHRDQALRLAVSEALMPGLTRTIAKKGWKGVSKFLKKKELDKKDVKMIVEALSAHLAGDEDRLKTMSLSLRRSLGIRE